MTDLWWTIIRNAKVINISFGRELLEPMMMLTKLKSKHAIWRHTLKILSWYVQLHSDVLHSCEWGVTEVNLCWNDSLEKSSHCMNFTNSDTKWKHLFYWTKFVSLNLLRLNFSHSNKLPDSNVNQLYSFHEFRSVYTIFV